MTFATLYTCLLACKPFAYGWRPIGTVTSIYFTLLFFLKKIRNGPCSRVIQPISSTRSFAMLLNILVPTSPHFAKLMRSPDICSSTLTKVSALEIDLLLWDGNRIVSSANWRWDTSTLLFPIVDPLIVPLPSILLKPSTTKNKRNGDEDRFTKSVKETQDRHPLMHVRHWGLNWYFDIAINSPVLVG